MRLISSFSKTILALAVLGGFLAATDTLLAQAQQKEHKPRQERVEITGIAEVEVVEDFDRDSAFMRYKLKTKRKDYQLRFRGPAPEFLTDDKIKVRGRKTPTGRIINIAADGEDSVAVVQLAPGVVGSRSALVYRVNMTDGSVSCSMDSLGSLMWTALRNADGLYQASAYGALNFPPDTNKDGKVEVVEVNIDSTVAGCNYSTWASLADQEAAKQGFTPSSYNHRGYVLPSTVGCSWAGLGNLGGTYARFWVKGSSCNTADVYIHEIGHNLGMHHASQGSSEYGDRSCPMGSSGVGYRYFNAPHAVQMGWVPTNKIVAANANRSYTLTALEAGPTLADSPLVLTLPKNDTNDKYFLSYRLRAGDSHYSSGLRTEYDARTFVHTHKGGSNRTFLVAALADGQSYTDAVNGITVTQLSRDDAAKTVQVAIGGECQAAAQTVTLSPAQQSTNSPGTALKYTVSVTNKDASLCEAGTFALGAQVPAGWSATLSPSTITLNAGQSGTATMTVSSALEATSGSYTVRASASRPTHSSVFADATYVIDQNPPSAPGSLSLAAVKRGNKITGVKASWTAAKDLESAISGYKIYRNGTLIGQVGASVLSYTDSSVASGSHSYGVSALDGAGNESVQTSATINLSGDSTKKPRNPKAK